jgi:perosamine synthetase
MNFFDTTITPEALEYTERCLRSGMLSEGRLVEEFEQRLAHTFGYRHGVAVNSGTAALHLALVLAGIKKGDEVIIPAQTFVATGQVILYCGAKPVFVDIQADTGNIIPERIIDRITPRTKAVLCVSWGGNPCDLMALQKVCQEHKLKLIQDNAQALGANYMGEPVSNYGDFSCFSFQAIKHLTTGDGGLLVCRTKDDYERARKLRWFGIDRKKDKADYTGERQYNLVELGYKYHMNDIAAAIGLGNLHGVKERAIKLKFIVNYFDEQIGTYAVSRHKGSANWLYTLLVPRRRDFIEMMNSKGIPVSIVHKGIHKHSIFLRATGKWDLPNQEFWDGHHICIPCHSSLTQEDLDKVTEGVLAGW